MKVKYLALVCATLLVTSCNSGSQEANKKEACCTKEESAGTTAACTADMKKIIGAKISVKADKVDEFISATKDLVEKSRIEGGNISYTIYQDPTDKTVFFVFEEWENQAAVDFHFATEHFKSLGAILESCASTPAVINIYDTPSQKQV